MRFPAAPGVVAALVLASSSFIGCSSSSAPQDPGLTVPIEQRESNPYGVAYPKANIGNTARKGTTPGSVMRNYKFLGYPGGDRSGGLKTVALADYFDPEMKKYKLVHLTVAGVWCGPCRQETEEVVPMYKQLEAQGVAFLQALSDGPTQGKGATKNDLDGWIQQFNINFDAVLDPDARNLGVFFDAAAIPWNANLDARTMEILSAGVGYSGSIRADIDPWLSWIQKNEPTKYE